MNENVKWSTRSPYLKPLHFLLYGFLNEKCCYIYIRRIDLLTNQMITSEMLPINYKQVSLIIEPLENVIGDRRNHI